MPESESCKWDHTYVEGSFHWVTHSKGGNTYPECMICRKKSRKKSLAKEREKRAVERESMRGIHKAHIRNNNFPNPHPIDNSEIPALPGWGYNAGGESKLVVLGDQWE